MKKRDLGQLIGVLANLGVIAGIVFLGVELQQNNEFLEAQARADRRDIGREAALRTLNNPDLRSATRKALNGVPLNDDEAFLLDLENQATLRDWGYLYRETQVGSLELEELDAAGWRRAFCVRAPGLRDYWARTKDTEDPAFVAWMEGTIENC